MQISRFSQEREWASVGSIPKERIIGAFPQSALNRPDYEYAAEHEDTKSSRIKDSKKFIKNNNYIPAVTKPSLNVLPIKESSYLHKLKKQDIIFPDEIAIPEKQSPF